MGDGQEMELGIESAQALMAEAICPSVSAALGCNFAAATRSLLFKAWAHFIHGAGCF